MNQKQATQALELAGHQRLAAIKQELAHLAGLQERIWMRVAELIQTIQDERLYRLEGYRSMEQYYPALLSELRTQGVLTVNSKRALQDAVRMDRVFRQALDISDDTLAQVRPSHLLEIAERLDYDPRRLLVAENPRPGKIGAERAREMVAEIVERGGEWRVEDTREVLDTECGVVRRQVEVLARTNSGESVTVTGIRLWEGAAMYELAVDGLVPPHLYEWFVKRLSAISRPG